MEDIKRRIQFQNCGIQIQAVWKIYQEIEKKRVGQAPLSEDSPEISELGLLLDGVCESDSLVAHVSGEVLLTLVQNDILHFTRALNMLLATAPSVACVSVLVRTVHQLLLMEALQTVASKACPYTSPYGLRTRPHPLISVLTHRPEAWHPLAQEIAAMFNHQSPKVQSLSLELVRPVVVFLLTEPQTTEIYRDARRGITRVLLGQVRPETIKMTKGHENVSTRSSEVVALLLKLLPLLPLKTHSQLIFAAELVEELSRAIRQHFPSSTPPADSALTSAPHEQQKESPSWPRLCARVFSAGLELLLECFGAGVSFQGLAVELTSLVVKYPSSAMSLMNINLVMLGEILDSPLALEFQEIITLAEHAVRASPAGANILCMASLLKPLLQIFATPNVISGTRGHSRVKTRAGEILLIIQQKLQVSDKQEMQVTILPDAFLGPHGLKCMLLVELCLSLINVNETKTNPATGRIAVKESLKTSNTLDMLEFRLLQWLRKVRESLERRAANDKTSACSSRLSRLASALLLLAPSEVLMKEASALVRQIARLEPSKALDFLPVVLHALGHKAALPECRLALLETLPDLATHKFCVSPILKIVLALSQSAPTRALAIRLMTRLWQQQDRCFPQLLKLLTDSQDGDNTSDISLAKAGAILDVCKLKPEKHGAEILTPLSRILENCSGPQGSAASAMLVDSLYLLCQAEVMDLSSLWNVLGSRLVEENETRPLVAARVCRLMSLTPDLAVETEEYKAFCAAIICLLWQFTQSSSSIVRQSAFEALSSFPSDETRVSYLPHQVTSDLRHEAELVNDQEKGLGVEAGAQPQNEANHSTMTTTVDQLYDQVPASCYIALLSTQHCKDEESLKGFERFLQTAVSREVSSLPRGVYFAGTRRQAVSGDSLARSSVDKIPMVLQQQYDRCSKETALRSALAAGLLFCYDPPVEKSRDGRQFIVRHSKMFMQMFANLLQEVRLMSMDWHVCSQLPDAWSEFMQRLFFAVREGRRAQLDFQSKQGNLSESEFNKELALAWVWSRDEILDVVRAASTGSQHAQANSILSLAGLALCVHTYAAQLDPAALEAVEGSSKFMGHQRWMTIACDTVLSLVNVEYKPLAGLFGLCRQLSTLDRVPASPICSTMARVAISQLVPVLMARPSGINEADSLQNVLKDLSSLVSSRVSSQEDVQPELAMWNGLALGLLLGRLFEEHFSLRTGSKGMLAVWKSLSSLETACLTQETQSAASDVVSDSRVSRRKGNLIGLTSALCGLCKGGGTDAHVHALSTLKKMKDSLHKITEEGNIDEILWSCVAMVSVTSQTSNANAEDLLSAVFERLVDMNQKHSKKVGVSLSLGLVASTMSRLGYKEADKRLDNIVNAWLKSIADEDASAESKLSSLCGLNAALGSERICPKGNSSKAVGVSQVSEIIKVVSGLVVAPPGNTPDLQCQGAVTLGNLHSALCSIPGSQSLAPPTYGYLPETSFLRAVVDFLLEVETLGSKSHVSDNQISALLYSLTGLGRSLPPLDWAGLLSPLMRVGYSEKVRTLCLQVAASQMRESPSAVSFLSSWLTPPFFNSLSMPSQAALHKSLPQVIRSVAPAVLKIYLERSCSPALADLIVCFTQSKGSGGYEEKKQFTASSLSKGFSRINSETREMDIGETENENLLYNVVMSVLAGLRDALAVPDPPQSVTMILYEALGRFYQQIPLDATETFANHYVALLRAFSECLALVPDDVLDSVLASDFIDASTQLKGSFVRCYLVASGLQPIPFLNIMIDASLNVPGWNHDLAIGLLSTCLACTLQVDAAEVQDGGDQWLTELLGHTRSIASGAWPLADSAPDQDVIIHRLISVVSSVFLVLVSLDHGDLTICGLDVKMFIKSDKKPGDDGLVCKSIEIPEGACHLLPQFYLRLKDISVYLPLSVLPFLSKKWDKVGAKVIDWLLTVPTAEGIRSRDKTILRDALLHLRHTQQFTQASVWTKAIEL